MPANLYLSSFIYFLFFHGYFYPHATPALQALAQNWNSTENSVIAVIKLRTHLLWQRAAH